jgi:antiviral helicase SKI2
VAVQHKSIIIMDTAKHKELIHKILHPNPEDAQKLLEDLKLAALPSPEQVHQEIEEKLLLPRDTLPDHWLPSYQVCDSCSSKSSCVLMPLF